MRNQLTHLNQLARAASAGALAFFGLFCAGVGQADAALLACDITTGVPGAGECQITTAHAITGAWEVDRTLHILGVGRIDASGGGITLSICVAPALVFSTCDLIIDTPTVPGGGQIEASDTGASGNSASPIVINVSRDVIMKATSAILSNNTNDGGAGGNITITAGGNMTMCAAGGVQPGCGGASAGPGAMISAQKLDGGTAKGGNVTITVGDITKVTGKFYMEGGVTTYGAETGATIDTTSTTAHGGNITIRPGAGYFTEPGSVVQSGGHNATATQEGGKIFIVSGCQLTTEGRVTSKGPDPGADLVHLEGCEVIVRGLVESTGKGHAAGTPNSCDNVNDGLVGEVFRLGKPAYATGCIEVWGKVITIDSSKIDPNQSPSWAGELNADIGDGGPDGASWIDIFAFSKLTVTDGTGNDRISDNGGHTYFSTYAVHANAIAGSDETPGVVTAKVKSGPLTASGKAFEASSTMTNDTGHGPADPDPFVGNGSTGGTIDVEASGLVTLDFAFLNASGDFDGGASTACPAGGAGTCGSGGHIIVSAWGTGSNISWLSGDGDVRPNDSGDNGAGGSTVGGDITLNACGGSITTTFTEFHGETTSLSAVCDASKPTIPVYNTAADGSGTPVVIFNQAVWALCSASTISGLKFNDLDADGNQDPGEPGLSGWVIHLFNGSVHMTQATSGSGAYTFTSVPPGIYTICEQLPAASPPWQQTFPASGANCLTATDPASDNPTPGPVGHTVDLTGGECCTGQDITGKNFGNIQLAIKSGIKWEDMNGNGIRNLPGDVGLPGWKIHLFGTAVNGSPVNLTQTTGAGGAYAFNSLLPGTYTVCEELQTNWVQTFPATAVTCAGIPTPGPKGYSIILASGAIETNNDFGNTQYASKSGIKWDDVNGNGIRNLPGDVGLPGWKIHLFGTAGNGSAVHLVRTTGVGGAYTFDSVLPGTYTVCEEMQAPWVQKYPTALTPGTTNCVTPGEGVLYNPTPGPRGYSVTLTSGKNETGNDFGNDPNLTPVCTDTTPPSVALYTMLAGPPKTVVLKAQDTGSGIRSITVIVSTNVNVPLIKYTLNPDGTSPITVFPPGGITAPIYIFAPKLNQNLGSVFGVTVADQCKSTVFDPVDETVYAGKPVTLTDVPGDETLVRIANNNLKSMSMRVNGRQILVGKLTPHEIRIVDIRSVMVLNARNTITFTATGPTGSSASVLVYPPPAGGKKVDK